MEKPLKKATLVLWIIGGLTVLGSLLSLGKDFGTAVVGILLGLFLGLIGYLVGRKRSGKAAPEASAKVSSSDSPYDIRKYRVAGVTFETGKTGHKSRQGILRHMHFQDPPYDNCTIVPKVYDFEGSPAIGLYVNGDENEQKAFRKCCPLWTASSAPIMTSMAAEIKAMAASSSCIFANDLP